MLDRARRCLRHLTHPECLCVVKLDSVVSKCGPSSSAMNRWMKFWGRKETQIGRSKNPEVSFPSKIPDLRWDHFCPFFRHDGAILRIGDVDGKFSHVSVCYFFHARSRLVVPANRVLETQDAPRAHNGSAGPGHG